MKPYIIAWIAIGVGIALIVMSLLGIVIPDFGDVPEPMLLGGVMFGVVDVLLGIERLLSLRRSARRSARLRDIEAAVKALS